MITHVALTRDPAPEGRYGDGHATDARAGGDGCAIIIRTYHRDLDWLAYALRSVRRWCHGFTELIVVTPRFSASRVGRALPTGVRLEICPDHRDDYLGQQVSKLYADLYTDAAVLCHLDADMVFQRPVTPADLFTGGRPRIGYRPVGQLGRYRPWLGPTEAFLGAPVAYDFMCHPPFAYPRWLYPAVREHCLVTHGMPLDEYVLGRPPRGFSEFNALGAYAYHQHRDAFAWAGREVDPPLCRWYWSRGGIDAATRRELERLSGPGL
ncbi:hypothetical protein ONA91_31585 [Micromonospora sp. DR5-3]|uniref:hypothetical protein n=1 Tax=unclassified Micromonospora TaxID=2617518 RepID=UPI0016521E6B|nr:MULTISPECIES: hypothetical protein [unclassified Micromonospora]MCW3818989.1 hypothetical protein [Micromonospora sp. DR5-3]